MNRALAWSGRRPVEAAPSSAYPARARTRSTTLVCELWPDRSPGVHDPLVVHELLARPTWYIDLVAAAARPAPCGHARRCRRAPGPSSPAATAPARRLTSASSGSGCAPGPPPGSGSPGPRAVPAAAARCSGFPSNFWISRLLLVDVGQEPDAASQLKADGGEQLGSGARLAWARLRVVLSSSRRRSTGDSSQVRHRRVRFCAAGSWRGLASEAGRDIRLQPFKP